MQTDATVANHLVRVLDNLVPFAIGNLHDPARKRDQVLRHSLTLAGWLVLEQSAFDEGKCSADPRFEDRQHSEGQNDEPGVQPSRAEALEILLDGPTAPEREEDQRNDTEHPRRWLYVPASNQPTLIEPGKQHADPTPESDRGHGCGDVDGGTARDSGDD